MLNITNRRGSTNQTHKETLPRVCQDGHRQTHRRQALTRRSGDPGALLGEMRHEAAAIENSVEGSSPKMFRYNLPYDPAFPAIYIYKRPENRISKETQAHPC